MKTMNIYSGNLIVFEGEIDKEFYNNCDFFEDALDDCLDYCYKISNKKNQTAKKDSEDDYSVTEIWKGNYKNGKFTKEKIIMRGLISSRLADRFLDIFADTYGIFFYNDELYVQDANVRVDRANLVEDRVKDLIDYFDYNVEPSQMMNAIWNYIEGR